MDEFLEGRRVMIKVSGFEQQNARHRKVRLYVTRGSLPSLPYHKALPL